MKDKICYILRVVVFIVFTIAVYLLGKFDGLTIKRNLIVGQVEEIFNESIRTGQPFVFDGSNVRFVSKEERNYKIVFRVHQFIWPEDEEILPTPVNKFGQYGMGWENGAKSNQN